LAGKLQELSTRFRKSQAVYLQKIRGRDMGSGGGGGASLGNSAVGKDLFSQFSSTGGGGGGDTSFDLVLIHAHIHALVM
jgi:hypothetical protein